MNIILWLILGWMFGEIIHLTAWEYIKKKFNLKEKIVRTILIFLGIALIVAVLLSGFYRVTSYEDAVVTKFYGQKIVDSKVGIKYSILSSVEKIDLRKKQINFQKDGNVILIITKDNKPLEISAILEYKIDDVNKFAIQSYNTEDKIYSFVFSMLVKEIQSYDYEYVKSNKNIIEDNLFNESLKLEEDYGISILKFKIIKDSDTSKVIESKSEAESSKITSLAQKNSNDLLKSSLDNFSNEELDYLKTKMLSENNNIKWVLSNGGSVIVNG